MDTTEIDRIREALFTAQDEQRAADIAANETNSLLGQQKIMYNNEARGTLYSGQPTWERAQLAATTNQNLAKIESDYMKQRLSVWDNITDTLDRINSYNEAAKALTKATANNTGSSQSFLELYQSLQGGN